VPSTFEHLFDRAIDRLLSVEGEPVSLYRAVGGSSQTPESVVAIFNEQAGAVDENRRAIFTLKASDLGTPLERGDWFVLTGETDPWYVVDVRDDESGGIEVRCDGKLVRI
jgi:hypothetical protein